MPPKSWTLFGGIFMERKIAAAEKTQAIMELRPIF